MLYLTEPHGSRREHFGHLAREFAYVGIASVLEVALEKHHGDGVNVYAAVNHDVATFDRKRLYLLGRQVPERFANKALNLRLIARGEDEFSLCAEAGHGSAILPYPSTDAPRSVHRGARFFNLSKNLQVVALIERCLEHFGHEEMEPPRGAPQLLLGDR